MRKNSLEFSDPKIDPYKPRELAMLNEVDSRGRMAEPNIRTDICQLDKERLGIDAFAYGAREIKLDSTDKDCLKSYEDANRTRPRPPNEKFTTGANSYH